VVAIALAVDRLNEQLVIHLRVSDFTKKHLALSILHQINSINQLLAVVLGGHSRKPVHNLETRKLLVCVNLQKDLKSNIQTLFARLAVSAPSLIAISLQAQKSADQWRFQCR